MRTSNFFMVLMLFLVSCEIAPKPIAYGTDTCAYCSMTIVDQQHAAELVTEKGRPYKFDAIECMINYDLEHDQQSVELYLVNDFSAPGTLIDAKTATYLVSSHFSSPMGANLAAFSSEQAAVEKEQKFGGELYDWNAIRASIDVIRINN